MAAIDVPDLNLLVAFIDREEATERLRRLLPQTA